MTTSMRRAFLLVTSVAVGFALNGCGEQKADSLIAEQQALTLGSLDDAGDAAFFRQVVPVLYGRKVKGYQELKVLTDLSAQVGREAVVRQLMAKPEYVAKWSDVLVDALRIQREGFRDQSACYGAPLSRPDHGELAQYIDGSQSTWDGQTFAGVAPVADYNMADLIQSSVALDNLAPTFRGGLLTLVEKKTTSMSPAAERQELGTVFEQTYVNRRSDCIGCHNSVYSTTGGGSGWDRTFAIPGNLDEAIFGAAAGVPDLGGTRVNAPERLHAFFRADVACDPEFSAREPLNLTGNMCPTYNYAAPATTPPTPPPPAALPVGWVKPLGLTACGYIKTKNTIFYGGTPRGDSFPPYPYFAENVPPQFASIWDVEEKFRRGVEQIRNGPVTSPPLEVLDNKTGTYRYVLDEEGNYRYTTSRDAALALLVAEHAVDNVWKEIMGTPLTLPHGFARNEQQQQLLWELRDALLPNWSLKNVILRIVLSDAFNRRTPRARGVAGAAVYDLPMVFNPWIASSAWTSTASGNSIGDSVHRYSARDLFYSAGASLGIAGPRRVPPQTVYPTRNDAVALGQFLSDSNSGSTATTYQGLLAWESLHGTCVNRSTTGFDWVSRFMQSISYFPQSGPGVLTMADVVSSMRDWLLADGTLSATLESEALAKYFGVATLAGSTPLDVIDLEGKLRGYCGVLMKSPQYMLAGMPTSTITTPAAPRVRACNDGECSYQEICQGLQSGMWSSGLILSCDPSSLWVTQGNPEAKSTTDKTAVVKPTK